VIYIEVIYKLTAGEKIPFSKPKGKLMFFSQEKLDSWFLNNISTFKDQIIDQAVVICFT